MRLRVRQRTGLYLSQEQEQLAAIKRQMDVSASDKQDKDFEGGYGGQDDLEDRYATTSGEH